MPVDLSFTVIVVQTLLARLVCVNIEVKYDLLASLSAPGHSFSHSVSSTVNF